MNIILNEKGIILLGIIAAVIYLDGWLDGAKYEQNKEEKRNA